MAIVKPFQAVRPQQMLADKVAALPYDVYNRAEACAEVKNKPLSFLNIDRAETQFDDSVDTYDERVYEKARTLLEARIDDGTFVQDGKPCYYIYELTMDGRPQTGLVACSSIDDYAAGIVKKHENTRADKEADRIHHVDTTNAQTGPIFLAYREVPAITAIIERVKKEEEPLYDFISEDGISHKVWLIDFSKDIEALEELFGTQVPYTYIADGHHRAASAVAVGMKRRAAKPDYDGTEQFNYFLSVLFPDEQLMILPYNRVVKDLNGLSPEAFMEEVKKLCLVEDCKEAVSPKEKGHVGMYIGGCWYELTIKPEYMAADAVDGLDVSILQNLILTPILGIGDPKTDRRIDFVGGIRGTKELERRVNSQEMVVAFSMYPTSIQELLAVADAGRLMPPKSTWFEPKLRSGLFIHSLKD